MKILTRENKDIKKEDVIRIYEDLLKKVVDGVRRCFGKNLFSVVLYGSLARGAVKKDSDIDLLIIFEDLPRERLKRQDIFIKMEGDVDEEIKRIYEKQQQRKQPKIHFRCIKNKASRFRFNLRAHTGNEIQRTRFIICEIRSGNCW